MWAHFSMKLNPEEKVFRPTPMPEPVFQVTPPRITDIPGFKRETTGKPGVIDRGGGGMAC